MINSGFKLGVILHINQQLKKRSYVYLPAHKNETGVISFASTYWLPFVLAILFASAGIAMLLYFRNKENSELSKNKVRMLMILRFLSFFLIAFLLLSPFVKNLKKITQKPLIITAWDNSESIISTADSAKVSNEISMIKTDIADELGNGYSVIDYAFGEKTERNKILDFKEKKSDYSELLTSVNNDHLNENVGALIIAGDGIYNEGKNPINLTGIIKFPVYTIGLGDTTEVSDARIENIRVNRTAFSGNKFPVEADIHLTKLKGKKLKFSVSQNGVELQSTVVTPPNDDYFETHQFILDAGTAGLKHFLAVVETVQNERNTKNNSAEFVVNVLENKQKILILADGAHPDIGAIENTLKLQKSYDVSVFTTDPYPKNLSDFNLIILNQLPTSGKSAAQIIEASGINRIPLLFIVGNKTFIPQLNTLNQGVKISLLAGSSEEAQATINPTYATFNLSENFKEIILRFPPLQVPFANFDIAPTFTPLFYQKIKNIETAKPLLATGTLNGRKIGFIFGEGIWRWRIYNYYFSQNQDSFNELINQLVQYLSLRENEDNFIIDYKAVYAEIDDVILHAEVYNDVFERITSEEVNIKIQNPKDEEFNFTFDVQGDEYNLNAGHLPVGDYRFTAEVTIGNETFSEKGIFTVTAVNLENIITRANHQTLYQLASQSEGKYFLPGQIDNLVNEIKNNSSVKPVTYFQEMVNELLNLRWIFFILLLLLSVEWFLRKYWGIY